MARGNRRSAIVATVTVTALLCIAAVPVYARGTQEAERDAARRQLLSELSAAEAAFPVAVAAVVAEDAALADRLTLGSLAEIVRNLATGPPVRYLSPQERHRWAAAAIDRYRVDLLTRMEDRRRAIERERLSGADAPDETDTRRAVSRDETLRELGDRLAVLDSIDPAEVTIPETVPIEILDEPQRYRRVLPSAAGLARMFPDARMLVYLRVEPLGELLLLRVLAWDPTTGREREILREIGRRDALPELIEAHERELVAAITGQPLGGIAVTLRDDAGRPREDARVFVDGVYRGVTPYEDRYVPAGEYRIRTEIPDGRHASTRLTVPATEVRAVALTIDDPPPETVEIRTQPPGAGVYRGSLWVGYTPLSVPRGSGTDAYTLRRDGFYDSRVVVDRSTPATVERVLVSTDRDWAQEVRDSRDRFYRSFGLFAVSLGVPILINGAYQNYGGLAAGDGSARLSSDLTAAEQERVLAEANALYYGYYAGVGLSAGLFGNMIWRLVRYVRTAQGYHTR